MDLRIRGVAVHGDRIIACSRPQIFSISLDGVVTVLAGGTEVGFADGNGPDARFTEPQGVAIREDGSVVVADTRNHSIRLVTPEGDVTTLAGNGEDGFADGNGPNARFYSPYGVAVRRDGTIVVADTMNHSIRLVTPEGDVTTLAGNGDEGFADGNGPNARFSFPLGVAVRRDGTIVVADTMNDGIRLVYPNGDVTTLAGNGEGGFADGNGPGARLSGPHGIAVRQDGAIVVSDTGNNRIRLVTPEGDVTTLAGNGERGLADGSGLDARFDIPFGVAVFEDGKIVVSSLGRNSIRLITDYNYEGDVMTKAAR